LAQTRLKTTLAQFKLDKNILNTHQHLCGGFSPIFFFKKKEGTASSPSGCHMGHYKVMLDGIRQNQPTLAEITIAIAQTFLITLDLSVKSS
jgi:hypothetical protein